MSTAAKFAVSVVLVVGSGVGAGGGSDGVVAVELVDVVDVAVWSGTGAVGIAVGSDVVCGSFDATWSNEAAWASAADTWALAAGMANAIAAIAPTSTPVYLFLMTTSSLPSGSCRRSVLPLARAANRLPSFVD